MKAVHGLLLAVLVLAVPACGGNISVPAPLLDDQFNGGFPGVNWTPPATTGSGTTVQITSGRLAFTTTSASSSATTTTQMSFANPSLSMDFQAAILPVALTDQGAATVAILDHTMTVVASLTWDSPTQMVTYKIQGTTVASVGAPPNNGSLSGFRFTVDSMGQAAWFFNNAQQGSAVAIPAGKLFLQIGAAFGTGTQWPEIDFDNVTITSP